MSVHGATYGPRFLCPFLSDESDGAGGFVRYRLVVQARDFSGPTETARVEECRWIIGREGGSSGPADPLAPLGTSIIAASIVLPGAGRMSEVIGKPDGYWRGRVEREEPFDSDTWELEVQGHLIIERNPERLFGSYAFLRGRYQDGIGLLNARAFVGGSNPDFGDAPATDPESLLDGVARVLSALGGDWSDGASWQGLTTLVDARPWLPPPGGPIPSTADPLARIMAKGAAWRGADGSVSMQRDALVGIAERMQACAFQSGGRWWLVSRPDLARLAGEAPTFVYPVKEDGSGIDTGAGTLTVQDLIIDGLELYDDPGAPEDAAFPVRQCTSVYRHTPLDNAVFNPSFEDPLDPESPADTDAESWTYTPGADGVSVEGRRTLELIHAEWSDTFGFHVGPSTSTPAVLEQNDLAFLATSPNATLAFSFWKSYAQGDVTSTFPTWRVRVGGYKLEGRTVTTIGDVLKKAKSVPIAPFLNPDGNPTYVVGTPIVPEGASIEFDDGAGGGFSADLREDLKVGDRVIVCDVPENLDLGATARVYIFVPDDAAESETMGVTNQPDIVGGVSTYFRTPEAEHVYGWLGIRFESGVDEDALALSGLTVDDVTVTVRQEGRTAGTIAYRAALTGDAPGFDVALPTGSSDGHPLGDGPLVDSDTGLLVLGEDGAVWPTTQGQNTGWKEGAYVGAEASTGRTIDGHFALQGLRQLAGPLARVGTTFDLKRGVGGGAAPRIRPHHVLRHYTRTALAYAAFAGTETVYTYGPARVGQPVRIGIRAAAETRTCLACVAGVGVHTLTLDAPLDNDHAPRTQALCGVLAWWTGMEIDFLHATVAYEGEELALPAVDALEEIITDQ